MALSAEVRFSWTPSETPGIVKQTIQVVNTDADEVIFFDDVAPEIRSIKFWVPEQTNIQVNVTAHTYKAESDPLVFEFNLDDLELPRPIAPGTPAVEVLRVVSDGTENL